MFLAIGPCSHLFVLALLSLFLPSHSGWFLGTWPVPRDWDPLFYQGHTYGNAATCSFQGFIFQFGNTASLLFNASLAVIFLLLVRYHWNRERLIRLFTPAAACIWVISVGSSLALLFKKLYNPTGPLCWINSPRLPDHCFGDGTLTANSQSPMPECPEVIDVTPILLTLQLVPTWLCITLDSIIMLVIYRQLKNMERVIGAERDNNNNGSSSQNNNNSVSKLVAKQGMWYITGFFLSFGFVFVSAFVYLVTGDWNGVLDRAGYFGLALQGFWNFLIFSRGRTEMNTVVGRYIKELVWNGRFCGNGVTLSCRYSRQSYHHHDYAERQDHERETKSNDRIDMELQYCTKSLDGCCRLSNQSKTVEHAIQSTNISSLQLQTKAEEQTPKQGPHGDDRAQIEPTPPLQKKPRRHRHRWIGYFVSLKRDPVGRSPYISELGESDFSRGDSDAECPSLARGSHRPAMLSSSREEMSQHKKDPPRRPVRVLSSTDTDVEGANLNLNGETTHYPPRKPERLVSIDEKNAHPDTPLPC